MVNSLDMFSNVKAKDAIDPREIRVSILSILK